MSATHIRPVHLEKAGRGRGGQLGWVRSMLRGVGALALLAVGAVHLEQYDKLYASVPTIGTLFVVNFAGATMLGILLLAPIGRWGGRWGDALVTLAAAGGVALAAGSFVM